MSLFCHNCKYHNRDNTPFCNLCGVRLLHLQTDSESNKKDDQPKSNFLSKIQRAFAEFLGDLAPSRLQKTAQREQKIAKFVDDVNSVNDISTTLSSNVDESVIDVTGSYAPISCVSTNENELIQYDQVPECSQTDIEYANDNQRKFYNRFRDSFLKGIYLDIEGNSNYAFILLFDLLEDYGNHQDLSLLESQYEKLKLICPKTESYCRTLLTDLMESMGDYHGVERANANYYKDRDEYYGNDCYTLGKKYEKELKPSKYEEALLRYISKPNNVFCDIEFCFIEVLKLFLKVVRALDKIYEKEGESFDNKLKEVVDTAATLHYRCRRADEDYQHTFESVKKEFLTWLFKNCENAARQKYRHAEKLKIKPFSFFSRYPNIFGDQAHVADIQRRVIKILPSLVPTLLPTNETTERSLNAISKSRWKEEFKKITEDFDSSGLSSFVDHIFSLAERNDQNPSSKNIYFEASEYLAKKDRLASIEMYLRYLHLDLHSKAIENKQHTKETKEALFSTSEQLREFQKIVSELIADKDLRKALEAAPRIYAPRKKTELDQSKFEKPTRSKQTKYNMLNELENESLNEYPKIKENDHREFKIEHIPKERKVLDAVPRIYAPRKKIELDPNKIQKVQVEHEKTVSMLNEFELDDESANEDTEMRENEHEELEVKNAPQEMNSNSATISSSIALDPVHTEMLKLFLKSALEASTHDDYFKVSALDLDSFAEANGMFKNQVIDQINDACFELLDDEPLIEEDEGNFVIYKPYYEKIYEQMNDNER